jgi:hypothetical protein
MRECPKCFSQYGDELKICRTCGAILEAVAGESQQAAQDYALCDEDDDARETTRGGQPSWTCSQCHLSVPGGFEICWNCGTTRDGVLDPDFNKQPEGEDGDKAWEVPELDAVTRPIERSCPRCGSQKIIPNTRIRDQGQYSDGKLQVVLYGDPDALIFKDRVYDELTADICGNCGHVELSVASPEELYEHYLRSRGRA